MSELKLRDRTRERPRQQEEEVARKLGGKRQPASGAMPHAKGDVLTTRELVDCKTSKSTLSLGASDIVKHVQAAHRKGLIPIFDMEVRSLPANCRRWVIMPFSDYEEMRDQ